jgi:hypothetical protein
VDEHEGFLDRIGHLDPITSVAEPKPTPSTPAEPIGESSDYACTQCLRPYTAKDVEGWTVECPTCSGHSGDPYSHEPFECTTCGGKGKVPAFDEVKPQPDSSSISTETFEEFWKRMTAIHGDSAFLEAAKAAIENWWNETFEVGGKG